MLLRTELHLLIPPQIPLLYRILLRLTSRYWYGPIPPPTFGEIKTIESIHKPYGIYDQSRCATCYGCSRMGPLHAYHRGNSHMSRCPAEGHVASACTECIEKEAPAWKRTNTCKCTTVPVCKDISMELTTLILCFWPWWPCVRCHRVICSRRTRSVIEKGKILEGEVVVGSGKRLR